MPKGMTEFGKWLCQQMDNRGINQEDLAEEVGMSDRSIRRYIYADCMPKPSNLKKIMDYFGGHIEFKGGR